MSDYFQFGIFLDGFRIQQGNAPYEAITDFEKPAFDNLYKKEKYVR